MATTANLEKYVAQGIALRDKIKQIQERHKTELAPYLETQEQLKNALLSHLNQVGADSIRTGAGTFFRAERVSASLADPDAFMKYVTRTGKFDLLDRKANKTAVEAYMEEHGVPPPGVSYTKAYDVNIRRK